MVLQMWEVQIVRLGGVIVATLVFFGLSKYLLHSDPLFSQGVVFAITVFSLGVLDHYLRIKKTPRRTIAHAVRYRAGVPLVAEESHIASVGR